MVEIKSSLIKKIIEIISSNSNNLKPVLHEFYNFICHKAASEGNKIDLFNNSSIDKFPSIFECKKVKKNILTIIFKNFFRK